MAFCEDCPLAGFAAALVGAIQTRKGKRPVIPVKKGKKSAKCAMPCLKIYGETRAGVLMERPSVLLAKRLGLNAQSLGMLARIALRNGGK